MREDQPTLMCRVVSLMKILWTLSVVIAATAIGAYYGGVGHGVVGALALGFVGLVAGYYLSHPSMILQLLT